MASYSAAEAEEKEQPIPSSRIRHKHESGREVTGGKREARSDREP